MAGRWVPACWAVRSGRASGAEPIRSGQRLSRYHPLPFSHLVPMAAPAVTTTPRTSAACAPCALPLAARPFQALRSPYPRNKQQRSQQRGSCDAEAALPPLRRRRCRPVIAAQAAASSSNGASPGKRIVITGGSKGLGLAMAREFLGGYPQDSVVLCGRNAERLEAALADLRRQFGADRVHGTTCDVSSPEDVARLGEFVGERLGGVDIWCGAGEVVFWFVVQGLSSLWVVQGPTGEEDGGSTLPVLKQLSVVQPGCGCTCMPEQCAPAACHACPLPSCAGSTTQGR